MAVAEAKQKAEDTKFPQAAPFVLEPLPVKESVSEILAKIRLAVYKNGIRTPEYFRDNDGLRSGTVTETQVSVEDEEWLGDGDGGDETQVTEVSAGMVLVRGYKGKG